ncbi:hypothetical protein [Streptomyces sp. G45]|uniref:hypothetical protein n=1 Tax=Streptomyces sp. G45 TaxID=3406627 RepID=UPI003C15C2ED
MPRSSQFTTLSNGILSITAFVIITSGCSSSSQGAPPKQISRPIAIATDPSSIAAPAPDIAESRSPSGTLLPPEAKRVARGFVTAYAEHDATDSGDLSYADAGKRAARLATGKLAVELAQKRPGQEAPWGALKARQVRQTAEITSVGLPDGAPAPTPKAAFVRVAYTLTSKPRTGSVQHSSEQLALRLVRTKVGWRVADLPWA